MSRGAHDIISADGSIRYAVRREFAATTSQRFCGDCFVAGRFVTRVENRAQLSNSGIAGTNPRTSRPETRSAALVHRDVEA